jgi:hypothetical protein
MLVSLSLSFLLVMTIKVFGQKRVGQQQQQLLQLTFPLFIEPLLPYVQHLNKLEAARQAIKSSFLQKSNGQSVSTFKWRTTFTLSTRIYISFL